LQPVRRHLRELGDDDDDYGLDAPRCRRPRTSDDGTDDFDEFGDSVSDNGAFSPAVDGFDYLLPY
jgi:hypothetical protein